MDRLLSLPTGIQIHILAPIVSGRKGEYRQELKSLAQAGFARVKIDGQSYELGGEVALRKTLAHDIDLVVDRLVLREGVAKRLADSLEVASRYGNEVIKVEVLGGQGSTKNEELVFSQKFACVRCGVSYPEIIPRMFSFNSPYGACGTCGGLGVEVQTDWGSDDVQLSVNLPPCGGCGGTRL